MADRLRSELQRDRSQDRSSGAKEQLIKQLVEEIEFVTKRRDQRDKSFICHQDLKRIWSDRSRISTLLQPGTLSPDQIQFIQEHMIIILSTLVSVGAAECLTNFRARLFDLKSGRARLTDDKIPLEKNELFFLKSEAALQQNFYDRQFRFKPVVIEITSGQKTQKIKNRRLRLPFETCEEGVGAGGYGQVDCVGISPGYLKGESGSTWEKVQLVACKKITRRADFDKETDNLQILKESLTSHSRIMLHLAIIEHGINCYILLPYAKHGDLEQFLRCGLGPDKAIIYDFDKRFEKVRNGDVTLSLVRQCSFLAYALVWLHSGFKIENSPSKVFCAHMDLKPANILIQDDCSSEVGKWMISDFGISVVKAEAIRRDFEFGSIRDYYSQQTKKAQQTPINTRPTRQEGTYQAPEVKLSEGVLNQSFPLTEDQKGIGRRSDIWSYGCIFSEVLAFAVGKDELVLDFQSARKRQGKDYFYAEEPDQRYLTARDNMPRNYQVYPPVISWLDGLCRKTANPQRWVDCFVETTKQILIVDTGDRPDATQLASLVEHVEEHVAASRGDRPPVNCTLLKGKGYAQTSARGGRSEGHNRRDWHTANPSNQTPMLLRSDSSTTELLAGGVKGGGKLKDKDPIIEQEDKPLSQTASGPTRTSTTVEPRTNHSTPLSGQYTDDNSSESVPITGSRADSSASASDTRLAYEHGIMRDSAVRRKVRDITDTTLTCPIGSNFKATCFILAPAEGGTRAVYLVKSSVYVYRMDVQEGHGMSTTPEHVVELPPSDGWKYVTLTGHFLAAWGYSSHKLLHLCDIRDHQRAINPPSPHAIDTIESVTISLQGVTALLCGPKILVFDIGAQTTNVTLSAQHDQRFTDAAFSDTGDVLYAWAYGKKDSLYVWRCRDGLLTEKSTYEGHYKTDKLGKPYETRVIPYNTRLGCIVATWDKCYFPAQLRSSSTIIGNDDPLPRNVEFMSADIKAACIFRDHSLITLEKGSFDYLPCLKEYKIEDIRNHRRNPGGEICKLKRGLDKSPRLWVVDCGEKIVVTICNPNRKVTLVKLVPV